MNLMSFLKSIFRLSLMACSLCVLQLNGETQSVIYTNPVLAGDYPDPSIIRVGNDYWATATTSQWAPLFPILHSRDLVNWKIVANAMHKRPEWSDGSYWAPEIAEHKGRYFIYYTGRKRNGPLCVAVATAKRPSGPYTDHGPMICQDAGSIDAVPVTDEKGERYLVWKEDGNSRKLPTPLWAQKLSDDGTKLIGEQKEILRNDAEWEANLVEGPFILRRDDYFYMFYSGNACCGRRCNYALGVARSKALLGPWEKAPANPILAGNDDWRCPGHGSIVTDPKGRTFLLYHAYHPKDFVYAGRQALLDEVRWGADGWPSINDGKGPSAQAASPFGAAERNAEYSFFDDFTAARLPPGWQWPQAHEPSVQISNGKLVLAFVGAQTTDPAAAVLARSTTVGSYEATTLVETSGMKPGALAGLSAYGNPENALGIATGDGKIRLWRREKNEQKIVAEEEAPNSPMIYLRVRVTDGSRFQFMVSENGRAWRDVGGEAEGNYLPPWDLSIRIALTAGGVEGAAGKFEWLRITPYRKIDAKIAN
jgi:xylan 1,4-beta-xylosidase